MVCFLLSLFVYTVEQIRCSKLKVVALHFLTEYNFSQNFPKPRIILMITHVICSDLLDFLIEFMKYKDLGKK